MDWLFLLPLGLGLFFARDLLLLRLLRQKAIGAKALPAYAAVMIALFAGLGTASELVSREQALSLLRDARIWIPAVIIHAWSWLGFLRAKNAVSMERRVLFLTLIPAPVLLYTVGGLCWLALSQTQTMGGPLLGACVGLGWVTLLTLAGWWIPPPSPAAAEKILDFAGATNLSAILLLPMYQQQSEHSALANTALQTKTSMVALAVTAALIGASFLFHRLRRTP